MASLRQRRKGGNWHAVFVERSGKGRKNIEISLGTAIKHDAQKKLAELILEREKGFYGISVDKRQFKDIADDWLKSRKVEFKQNTVAFYENRLKCTIKPFFKDRMIDSITPGDIEMFKMKRIRDNASASTINHELCGIHAILDYAVSMGARKQNASSFIKKLKQKRKQYPSLTKEEAKKLIDSAEEGPPKTLLMFLIGTGLRIGEALGAKWKYLDFDKKEIAVKEAYSGHAIESPKTASSLRTVSVPDSVIAALQKHRTEQIKQRLKKGGEWQDNDFIFCSDTGVVLHRDNVRHHWFYPALEKSGIKKEIRLHDLRSAFATLALESGANIKAVQNSLGHATARMTMEVYARVNETARQETAEKLESYLFGITGEGKA